MSLTSGKERSEEHHLWLLTLTHSPACNKHIIEHVLLS